MSGHDGHKNCKNGAFFDLRWGQSQDWGYNWGWSRDFSQKKSKISLKAVVTSKQLRRHSVFSWSRAKYKTRKFEYTIQSLFQWASSFRIPLRNTWGMFKKSLRGLVINKTMLLYIVLVYRQTRIRSYLLLIDGWCEKKFIQAESC